MSIVCYGSMKKKFREELVEMPPAPRQKGGVGAIAKSQNRYGRIPHTKPPKMKVLDRKGLAVDTIEGDVWMNGQSINQTSEELMPVISPLPSELWNAARKNPKGRYITYHMTREAFRNKWKYTEPDAKDDDSLSRDLDSKLQTIRKERHLQRVHTEAVWLGRAVGRSLVIKFPLRPVTQPLGEWEFRVTHITDYNIHYDTDGVVTHYEPWVKIGRDLMPFKIEAARCELYVNNHNPLGNKYEGISELEASYYPMLWMSDILESWADIMSKRGLGILDVTIDGATEPELQKYKTENGDPSQYTVIFHDEKWHVAAPAAVSAQYNLDTMVGVYTKEIASADAVGESRLNGVPMGAVTGSKSDQDNFGQTVGSIQNDYHHNLLNLHVLADPSVKNKFDLMYDLSVRSNREETLANFSTAATAVNQTLDMMSFNQLLAKLDLPAVKDGDVLASYWMATHEDYNKLIPFQDPNQDPTNGMGNPPSPEKTQQKEEYKDREDKRLEERNETEIKKDRDSLSRSELKQLKINWTLQYLKGVDGYPPSYKELNEELKKEFGSGLSNSDLREVKN